MEAPLAPTEQVVRERYQQTTPGSAAEGELIQKHIALVKSVVGRVAMTLPSHVSIEDLQSAGLVGLLQAVRHYDPSRGTQFSTYARIRIHGAVMDELRRMDWVTRTVREKARKVAAVMQSLEQAKGGLPTEEEMAKEMQISVEEYRQCLDEIRPATFVSLQAVSGSDGEEDGESLETLADPTQEEATEIAARREMIGLIRARIEELPEMQRKVLALYYFEDLRLREIAEVFGVTESRICQIHSQAILAIKNSLRKHASSAATS
jgi:RNA polymerase sigma factor for flagellar operon FliA